MVQHGSGTAADGNTPIYLLAIWRQTRQFHFNGNSEDGGAVVSHRTVSQVPLPVE